MDCESPEAKHGLAPPSLRGSATLDPVTSVEAEGEWAAATPGKDSYWILDDTQGGGTRCEWKKGTFSIAMDMIIFTVGTVQCFSEEVVWVGGRPDVSTVLDIWIPYALFLSLPLILSFYSRKCTALLVTATMCTHVFFVFVSLRLDWNSFSQDFASCRLSTPLHCETLALHLEAVRYLNIRTISNY